MRVIELTRGQVAIVDDEDFAELAQHRWHYHTSSKIYQGYAARRGKRSEGKRTIILMHVAIMKPQEGFEIDHRNLNKLDNRRDNLRIATRSQNKCNTPSRRDNKLGVKGVSFKIANNKFVAQIVVNGKKKHLGLFETVEEAKAAFDKAAIDGHGEFARLN